MTTLTDFQRKHPHRSIGRRNHQTYLERSFADERQAPERAYWWDAGVIQEVLGPGATSNPYRARNFMKTVVDGMENWTPEEIARWWPLLWEAGASELTEAHTHWLYTLSADRPSCHFLLAQGVSPHEAMAVRSWGDGGPVSACVDRLERVLKLTMETYRPPTWERVEEAWDHLALLWKQPGWKPDQQVRALGCLTWRALSTPADHPEQGRWAALRDDLLAHCPDRWDSRREGGLLYRWIKMAPAPERPGIPSEGRAQWQAWGEALLSGIPPAPPQLRPISLNWLDRKCQAELAPFVARLADWGLPFWDVHKPDSFSDDPPAIRYPKTVLDALVSTPEQGLTVDLAPGWWEGLVAATQRLNAPPEAWQEAALDTWLRASLNHPQTPPATPEERCPPGLRTPEQQAAWVARWAQWGEIGGWAEQGIPAQVGGVFRNHQSTFSDLPSPLLKAMVPQWQRWGFLPNALSPQPPRAGSREALDPLKLMKPHHTWMMWSRLCADPDLQTEALLLLAADPDRLMAATALAHVDRSPPAAAPASGRRRCPAWMGFMQAACKAHPTWLVTQSRQVLALSLERREVETAEALLDLSAPLPETWKSWAEGMNASQMRQFRERDLLGADCPWLALAHRMNASGLSWEAGPAECRPLSVVANHWNPNIGDHAARSLLQAGADPQGVVDQEGSPTPNRACWAAAALDQKLAGPLEGNKQRRPRM